MTFHWALRFYVAVQFGGPTHQRPSLGHLTCIQLHQLQILPSLLTAFVFGVELYQSRKHQLLRTLPTNSKVFCAVYKKYVAKADLSKCYWNPKRKLGVHVTTHFSKSYCNLSTIFAKSFKIQALYGILFQIEAWLSLVTFNFFFWIPRPLAMFCFLCIVSNHRKIYQPVVVSTTNRKPEYHEMCRRYAQQQ